jgi:hypothetical protein
LAVEWPSEACNPILHSRSSQIYKRLRQRLSSPRSTAQADTLLDISDHALNPCLWNSDTIQRSYLNFAKPGRKLSNSKLYQCLERFHVDIRFVFVRYLLPIRSAIEAFRVHSLEVRRILSRSSAEADRYLKFWRLFYLKQNFIWRVGTRR